jgi:hypothetical protein
VTAESFAEWMRRQGYSVVRTTSSYWVELAPHIYQAFPYHWLIQPEDTELRQMVQNSKAIALRYSAPVESAEGSISYHVFYEGSEYAMSGLPKKARYDVRKGLRHVEIQPISFSRLATEGWPLRCDTLERQGRIGAENQAWWFNLCTSTEGLPGFEAWGAMSDGDLVASLLVYTSDDCCSILYQQSRTRHLSNGVNNALVYRFTNEVLKRPGIKRIFYGLHSLDAPATVDRFKFRMGYSAKAVRQRVLFHPRLRPLFNRGTHTALKHILRLQPGNRTLAKSEGLIRFYLEGKKPLQKQNWPPPLKSGRAELEASLR